MDSVLVNLAAAVAFAGPSLALIHRRTAPPAALALAAAAVTFAVLSIRGAAAEATLEVTHEFAAFVGSDIRSKQFVVDRATAPGWLGPGIAALWTAAWAALAWHFGRTQRPGGPHPYLGPLLHCWTGSAIVLLLQKTAAPAPLALGLQIPSLSPFAAVVWPAILAASLRLANQSSRVIPFVLNLSLFVSLAHLPLAFVGTLATRGAWGTYLDVRAIDFIANPLTQVPVELVPGSTEQLAWLVWVPQLLVWPSISMLTAGGLGFAALMARRQAGA
ncbi:MAG: hypothetical protein AAF628_15745 [Planctomycetota bacterium]